ncbi:putative bifunctional diguanylate cyclase/phosphodiesterase [Cellulomonas sp. 179-A 4D5 NHS]|uniref:putative bifunctional diguanylate cyclase/phosphodiesterase n=1 Tax=Cellulomonas sp. 179-A 4D5 NHS TaxID=3142378 RepID=UPI0039A35824
MSSSNAGAERLPAHKHTAEGIGVTSAPWRMRDDAYSVLFERSSDGILFTDPAGAILSANPAACRMLGRDEDDLRRVGRAGVIDPTDERWEGAVTLRNSEGYFSGELRARRVDGSTFVVDLSTAIVGEGSAIVLFRDLTPYIEVVERAGHMQRDAATVVDTLESMTDAYLAVDRDWTVTYLNQHAERLLRLQRGEAVGTNLWEAFPSVVGTVFEEQYRTLMRSHEPVQFEGYYEGSDLRCEVRAFPLSEEGMGVYFRDVSDRYAAEMERERLLTSEQDARTAAEAAQREATHQATHDSVTGLLNRWGLLREVEDLLNRDVCTSMTLLFVDLDQFKLVNDTHGHTVGDDVLAAVGQRLRALIPANGMIGRFGGDEFVVLLSDCTPESAEELARDMVASSLHHIDTCSAQVTMTISIGIARTEDVRQIDTLLRDADVALHRVKETGRDGFGWFNETLHRQTVLRHNTQRDLRRALAVGDQLELHFQPAFDLQSQRVVHVEALARWQHPERGTIPPLEFIPIAEESGLILMIGEAVISAAARQAAAWTGVEGVRVWVNVSPRQLVAPGLASFLEAELAAVHVPPERFGIEVTESTVEDGRLVGNLAAIRELGIAVAIDDFGTGFSSLARLARSPVDVVKIDRSFVAAIGTRTGDALLTGIVSLAHALGAQVIAEGIETPAQLDAVRAVGANAATGYLLGRPSPGDLMTWRSRHPLV